MIEAEVQSRTTIAKGMVFEGREYVGHFYFGKVNGSVAHATTNCPYSRMGGRGNRRLPVYREGGELRWFDARNEETAKAVLCAKCPLEPPSMAWAEEAACSGVRDDGFFDSNPGSKEVERVIETYCNNCPVALECLEFGASHEIANNQAVWGGVYFVKEARKRKPLIEQKRRELTNERL